jgi:hypothetical protein
MWKKRQESLTYAFKEELKKIGDIDDALYVEPNGQPKLLKMLITGQVSIETVCMLQGALNFLPYWEKEMDRWHGLTGDVRSSSTSRSSTTM